MPANLESKMENIFKKAPKDKKKYYKDCAMQLEVFECKHHMRLIAAEADKDRALEIIGHYFELEKGHIRYNTRAYWHDLCAGNREPVVLKFENTSDEWQLYPILIKACNSIIDSLDDIDAEGKKRAHRHIIDFQTAWWSKLQQAQAPQVHRPPKVLDTAEARKYFARAIKAGLMSEQYEWLENSQALLACFCREMSLKLGLEKRQTTDGKNFICWKPFGLLFGIDKDKLKGSLRDIEKIGQNPRGIDKVTSIFRD